MGCRCCKPSAIEDRKESPCDRLSRKPSTDLRNSRRSFTRRYGSHRVKDKYSSRNDERLISANKHSNGSLRLVAENYERRREKKGYAVAPHPEMETIPKATEGQQIAAGWPPWLVAAAGEAIKGWLPRRADSFEKLDKIGQGTYSNVYQARDLDHKKIVALKKVRFHNMGPESVRFMAREIHICLVIPT
ncbi:hypothetical protein MLD38_034184 [Melastoma candidum]|uniref:Uncharacterized protein n=1 Tax=Melastoma candidum TaxID=119954 RepID=A0ACB9MBR8_9MYRT|nr:hypothetical protein MLD38_034184 [Melastoma candidum]